MEVLPRFRLIIFDVYGTLLDVRTCEDAYRVWKTMKAVILTKTGVVCHMSSGDLKNLYYHIRNEEQRAQEQIYGTWAEIDEVKVFRKLLEAVGAEADVAVHCASDVAIIFRVISRERLNVYAGVEDTLRQLNEAGYRLGILSNAQTAFVEMEAGHLFKYFEDGLIFISSEHNLKKPSEQFYEKLLRTAGVSAEEAVMVGNSFEDDIRPAQALGLHTVYVNSNLIDESIPEAVDGVIHPDDFSALTKLLL